MRRVVASLVAASALLSALAVAAAGEVDPPRAIADGPPPGQTRSRIPAPSNRTSSIAHRDSGKRPDLSQKVLKFAGSQHQIAL